MTTCVLVGTGQMLAKQSQKLPLLLLLLLLLLQAPSLQMRHPCSGTTLPSSLVSQHLTWSHL
jgi:hypothetical protein